MPRNLHLVVGGLKTLSVVFFNILKCRFLLILLQLGAFMLNFGPGIPPLPMIREGFMLTESLKKYLIT